MANLFKKSSLHNKIINFQIKDLEEKLEIINKWVNAIDDRSLFTKTESQCEQAFNNDFFIKLLNYTAFPEKPYKIEPKASTETSNQKPDAILGTFNDGESNVIAVVEIKDANTPLDKPQKRAGNLSPIQQAFKYKPQYKNCRFVLATNFIEIRLFQNNELDYEVFNLRNLADPKDNYYELKKFIFLLSANNFVSVRGKTKTEELLSEIKIVQEAITEDFYKNFSRLRLELMRNLWKNNSEKRDITLITKKAQKLLDRIVFVCFCEDTGLLPEHTLSKVFQHAEDSYSSLWDTLKGFFNAIDKGSEKLDIPHGYNGGLFREDKELDDLAIDDHVLISLSTLSKYNFEDDLTVNILGHIFEQSISDLEDIRKKASPSDVESKQKSKRKTDAIYYTPDYIVDYIVKNSLGTYLDRNRFRIFEKHGLHEEVLDKTYEKREIEALVEYQEFLKNIKVLDPACGSGAFLVKVFDYLLAEHKKIGQLIGSLFDTEELYKEILRKNIYGVDLNEESVQITQLSLWLKTAEKGKKLTFLDDNIKVGNSLISSKAIMGTKAFDWQSSFRSVFESGGFDVIVGNPPYVATKEIPKEQREYFWGKYSDLLVSEMDLYEMFLYENIKNNLKKGGLLGFITPNSFYTTKSFVKLREYILRNTKLLNLVDFPYRFYPFEDVNKETCIQIYEKDYDHNNQVQLEIAEKQNDLNILTIKYTTQLQQTKFIKKYKGKITTKPSLFLENMLSHTNSLADYLELHKGWMSIPKATTLLNGTVIDKGTFSEEEIKNKPELANLTKRYLEGKDIHRYYIENRNLYVNIQNIDNKTLTWHQENKIILQRIVGQNVRKIFATLDLEKFIIFPNANLINITGKIDIYALLGILNSNTIDTYYNDMYGESNTNITKDAIEEIPCPNLEKYNLSNIADSVKAILNKTSELNNKKDDYIEVLKEEFSIKKRTKKIENYYTLSWEDFVAELGKDIDTMNFGDKLIFKSIFENSKYEIRSLLSEIQNLNNIIENEIKYIYGLN